MLGQFDANATVAVRDLDAAAAFYEGVLGLTRDEHQQPGTIRYKSGNSVIFVYPSEFARTNRATAVTWVVEDVDGVVRALSEKGARFERYEMEGMRHEGDVHVGEDGMRVAWVKDPDGNVLALAGR